MSTREYDLPGMLFSVNASITEDKKATEWHQTRQLPTFYIVQASATAAASTVRNMYDGWIVTGHINNLDSERGEVLDIATDKYVKVDGKLIEHVWGAQS